MRRWEAIRPISEVNHVPANIQMQKTGAGVAYQGDTAFPASDLERYAATQTMNGPPKGLNLTINAYRA